MVRYMKVKWIHESPDEPIWLYSEIVDGWEVRSVEVYADGHADYADADSSSGTTMLSETLMPTIEEIAMDEQFQPTEIDAVEFEEVWRQAHA
jgi:hypothetical protein